MGTLGGADQFIKLELDRRRVAVLRVLDQEHHQEGDDGGPGVDDQLPGVAVVEQGPGQEPQREDRDGGTKAGTNERHRSRLPMVLNRFGALLLCLLTA